ncbi:2'-5' RNA ligase family protein [Amycolatopsis pretoriensis]|uniref:2'-5' RNA ligase family protein n=1 Tax=Amycolatopsis pretoriensis TaxID=218821 RepID=UPI001FCA1AA0|nr:2'-5' RNA ligase family protein [Amycolatopsis pretoriensis]
MDDVTQSAWDSLRRAWFPPERLVVGAHVTLFHALPGVHEDEIVADCAVVAGETGPFTFVVDGVRSLGRGVALVVRAPELVAVHARVRRRWVDWLTAQDAQPLKPHVTVQNKVSPETAAATSAALREDFGPREGTAVGLAVWRYVGGPWEPVTTLPFAG